EVELAPGQGLGSGHRAGDQGPRGPLGADGGDPVGPQRAEPAADAGRRPVHRVGAPQPALGAQRLLRLAPVQPGEPDAGAAGGGAFNDRTTVAGLAEVLAADFTTIAYDRRGRGDSGDSAPYALEREIEDIAALIAHAGGTASVFGHSSGAVLALEAAAAGLPI